MAFKLIEAARDCWRAVNGLHLVALAFFVNGSLSNDPTATTNRKPPKRSITATAQNKGVDRPRSFRNDYCSTWLIDVAAPLVADACDLFVPKQLA
jgi:hypothetical protein